eukprot:114904_1
MSDSLVVRVKFVPGMNKDNAIPMLTNDLILANKDTSDIPATLKDAGNVSCFCVWPANAGYHTVTFWSDRGSEFEGILKKLSLWQQNHMQMKDRFKFEIDLYGQDNPVDGYKASDPVIIVSKLHKQGHGVYDWYHVFY